jgi:Acetyltransferase (GNAT) family
MFHRTSQPLRALATAEPNLKTALPMQTVVGLAEPGDLPGIFALYRELRPNDPELSHTEGNSALGRILNDANLHLVVGEHAGSLAATCMLAVVPNLAGGARPFGVIEHVVTLSQFRRQGLARLVQRFALTLRGRRTATRSFCCPEPSASRPIGCMNLSAFAVMSSADLWPRRTMRSNLDVWPYHLESARCKLELCC